jgi:hypothetical protein
MSTRRSLSDERARANAGDCWSTEAGAVGWAEGRCQSRLEQRRETERETMALTTMQRSTVGRGERTMRRVCGCVLQAGGEAEV